SGSHAGSDYDEVLHDAGRDFAGFLVLELEVPVECQGSFLDLGHGRTRLLFRAAFHHGDAGLDEVTGNFGQEYHTHEAAAHDAHGQDQHGNETCQGDVTIAYAPGVPGEVAARHETVEGTVAGTLDPDQRPAAVVPAHMSDVRGQDEL